MPDMPLMPDIPPMPLIPDMPCCTSAIANDEQSTVPTNAAKVFLVSCFMKAS